MDFLIFESIIVFSDGLYGHMNRAETTARQKPKIQLSFYGMGCVTPKPNGYYNSTIDFLEQTCISVDCRVIAIVNYGNSFRMENSLM